MIIALDYDDTYDRDPALWNHLIGLATSRGHSVVIVTMRYEHESLALPLALPVPHKYSLDFKMPLRYGTRHGGSDPGRRSPAG